MSDQFLPFKNPTSTDRKVDTEQLTVGANTVERQRIQLAGATATALAPVINTAPTTEFGLVVRNIPSGTQAGSSALGSQLDGHSETLGAKNDAAASSDTATASLIALWKRALQTLTAISGKLPAALVSGRLDVNLGASPATVLQSSRLVNGGLVDEAGNVLVVKKAFGQATASGANSAIANVASKKIRVFHYSFQAEGAVTVKLTDTADTAITQMWKFQNAGDGCAPTAPDSKFLAETIAGNGVRINNSATVNVNWTLVYAEV